MFRKLQPSDFLDSVFDNVSDLPAKKFIVGYGKAGNASKNEVFGDVFGRKRD